MRIVHSSDTSVPAEGALRAYWRSLLAQTPPFCSHSPGLEGLGAPALRFDSVHFRGDTREKWMLIEVHYRTPTAPGNTEWSLVRLAD